MALNNESSAPSYSLDVPSYLSIEYPLKISDNKDSIGKSIAMIGGSQKISKCFIEPDSSLELRLRPDDVFSHPINSVQINSENVLLNIKIPKRVLKEHDNNILQSIQFCEDNEINYKISVKGVLSKNYKFRQLCDFQKISKHSKYTNDFTNSVQAGDLKEIKNFTKFISDDFEKITNDESVEYTNTDMDIPPLLRYARVDVPYNYQYFGNVLADENGIKLKKTVKLHTIFVDWNADPPAHYDPQLEKELNRIHNDVETLKSNGMERLVDDSPSGIFLLCLKAVKALFEMKPIWLRRHINWMLVPKLRSQLKFVLPFVSYTTKSGPWRQSYIKFGYTPLNDKSALKYQVESFRSSVKSIKDSEILKMLESLESDGEFENDGDGDGANDDHTDNNSNSNSNYVLPKTLSQYEDEFNDPTSEISKLGIIKLPKQLLYDGCNSTSAVSYQIGDLIDDDIDSILNDANKPSTCYESTGWLDWITVCRIRHVMKYKLDCIKKGNLIDQVKVNAIIKRTHFPAIEIKPLLPPSEASKTQGVGGEDEGEEDEDEDEDDEDEDGGEDTITVKSENVNEVKDDLISRLKQFNPGSVHVLNDLDGLLNQEKLMKISKFN